MTRRVLAGEETTLAFVRRGGGDVGTDYDQFRVSRAIYTVLADVVVAKELGDTPDQEAFDRIALEIHSLRLQA